MPMLMPKPTHPAPSALEAMLARERDWAARHGVAFDPAGQLAGLDDALCFAPDAAQRERLGRHPDRPLGETGKPAPAALLGSGWGVACNLLEAIPTDALDGLLGAFGAPGLATRRGWVHSLAELDVGGTGTPVLRIDRDAGRPLFVEVRGVELALRERTTAATLPRPEDGWGDLEGCRRVAAESGHGPDPIAVGGLLRRLRSLSRSHGRRGFRYVVVRPHFDRHFDDALRRAFDGLRMRIGGEVDFDAFDLATVHERLALAGDRAHPALAWLADRYLAGVTRSRA